MHSFAYYELEVIRWGEKRGIVQYGSPMGQAIKTLEETKELLDAINKEDDAATKDAIGDILVTLIMVCAVKDFQILDCLKSAYEEIKDRKGYLRSDGVFVKEQKASEEQLLVTKLTEENHKLWQLVHETKNWSRHINDTLDQLSKENTSNE